MTDEIVACGLSYGHSYATTPDGTEYLASYQQVFHIQNAPCTRFNNHYLAHRGPDGVPSMSWPPTTTDGPIHDESQTWSAPQEN